MCSFQYRRPPDRGFTLIEILLVVVIISILAAIALPQLQRVREKAQIARAIGDVGGIGWDIVDYSLTHGYFPNSLSDVGWGGKEDPWGTPYRYLKIRGASGGTGGMRKDRFLVPINSDFDLYSEGPDLASASALTAKVSHDDIIRANDGGFVGVAAKY